MLPRHGAWVIEARHCGAVALTQIATCCFSIVLVQVICHSRVSWLCGTRRDLSEHHRGTRSQACLQQVSSRPSQPTPRERPNCQHRMRSTPASGAKTPARVVACGAASSGAHCVRGAVCVSRGKTPCCTRETCRDSAGERTRELRYGAC